MESSQQQQQQQAVEYEWRLYPPPKPVEFHVGDHVFRRPKGAKERGRGGQVVLGVPEEGVPASLSTTTSCQETNDRIWMQEQTKDASGAAGTAPMRVSRNRLVPIYHYLDDSPTTIGDTKNDEPTTTFEQQSPKPKCRVIVTRETRSYRVLASSQFGFVSNKTNDDHVLEIGCSNGECSRILARYAPSLVGMDVSTEMVASCRRRHDQIRQSSHRSLSNQHVRFEVMNIFVDPLRAMVLARRRRHNHDTSPIIHCPNNNRTPQHSSQSQTNDDGHNDDDDSIITTTTTTTTHDNTHAIHDTDGKDAGTYKKRRTTVCNPTESVIQEEEQDRTFQPNGMATNKDPTVVFVDIGGNRDASSVVKMVDWVLRTFSSSLRLVVIKSEELVDQHLILGNRNNDDNQKRQSLMSLGKVQDNGMIVGGQEWFGQLMQQYHPNQQTNTVASPPILYTHPLKAPLVQVECPGIDSTMMISICRYHNYHKQGCRKHSSGKCTLDHHHCHWCLQTGHIALECLGTVA